MVVSVCYLMRGSGIGGVGGKRVGEGSETTCQELWETTGVALTSSLYERNCENTCLHR